MALEGFANAPVPSNPSIPAGILTSGIDASTTTIPISSTAFLPSASTQFRFRIGDELFLCTSRVGLNLTVAARPQESTTATTHASGSAVYVVLTAAALAGAVTPPSTFNVVAYGALGDGTTDDSAAVIAAIAAASAAGGGTVLFPVGTYRIDSQIVLPNDGGGVPKQKPIKFQGSGPLFTGQAGSPNGGSILDLRYVGSPAKIDTRGLGLLQIADLTLEDTTDGTTAFIQTTNTTLLIYRTSFFGKTAGATAVQDAIVLGGTGAVNDGSATSFFQGYGTVIRDNYFARIRRGVYGRRAANGVAVIANTWWNTCGGVAALESDASGGTNAGWYIAGNLIEETNYTYAFKFTASTSQSALIGNNIYDHGGVTTAHYRFEDGLNTYNLVIAGFHDDVVTALSEAGNSVGKNTYLTSHQTQTSSWVQPWAFTNTVQFVNAGSGPQIVDASGNYWRNYDNQADGSRFYFQWKPNGGSAEDIAFVHRASATDTRIQLLGSGDSSVRATTSQMRVYAAIGQALFFGDATNFLYALNGQLHNPLSSGSAYKATSGGIFGWTPSTTISAGIDTGVARNGAGIVEINNGTLGAFRDLFARAVDVVGANGQDCGLRQLTELTTIAAAATTDTTIQMPANSIVLSVSVRVTTVIPTAATFTVGDSGSAARFSTAAVSTAANSTDSGTKAGAYYNSGALSVRITPDLTPANNSGRVRTTIVYLQVTAPTS